MPEGFGPRVIGFVAATVVTGFALILAWYLVLTITGNEAFFDCHPNCGPIEDFQRQYGRWLWWGAFAVAALLAWWRIFARRDD